MAKVTSRGRVTLPKALRDALGVAAGDHIMFRLEGNRAVLTRVSFLDSAGSVRVPAAKQDATWDEVVRCTRVARRRQ